MITLKGSETHFTQPNIVSIATNKIDFIQPAEGGEQGVYWQAWDIN